MRSNLCRDVDLCVLKESFGFRQMLVLGCEPGFSSISMITKCWANGGYFAPPMT